MKIQTEKVLDGKETQACKANDGACLFDKWVIEKEHEKLDCYKSMKWELKTFFNWKEEKILSLLEHWEQVQKFSLLAWACKP